METKSATRKTTALFSLDVEVKEKAQKAAKKIDLPLSSIVNNYLYHFNQNTDLVFEYPSPKLIKLIKEAKGDIKKVTSPLLLIMLMTPCAG